MILAFQEFRDSSLITFHSDGMKTSLGFFHLSQIMMWDLMQSSLSLLLLSVAHALQYIPFSP